MERKKIERKILSKDAKKLSVETISVIEIPMEEALKKIDSCNGQIAQFKQETAKLQNLVDNKLWEKDFANFKDAIENEETMLKILTNGTKDYIEGLSEEGRKKVEYYKHKDGYNRLPKSLTEKRAVVKNQILVKVMEELNLKDVSHHVMMYLRHECFKEEKPNGKEKTK